MLRNRREKTQVSHLAGWLFADLLLALFVIFLGVQVAAPSPSDDEIASVETTILTEETLPSRDVASGMSQQAEQVDFTIDLGEILSPRYAGEVERLAPEVARKVNVVSEGRIPGLVLVWGHHRDRDTAKKIAERFRERLPEELPDLFSQSAFKDLSFQDDSSGYVVLEIFFFNG